MEKVWIHRPLHDKGLLLPGRECKVQYGREGNRNLEPQGEGIGNEGCKMGTMTKEIKDYTRSILKKLNTPIDNNTSNEGNVILYPHYKMMNKWEQEDDYAIYMAINSKDPELIQLANEVLYNGMAVQKRDSSGQVIFIPLNVLGRCKDRFDEFLKVNGNRSEEEFLLRLYEITLSKIDKYDPTKGKNRSHSSVYNFIDNTCMEDLFRTMHVKEGMFGKAEKKHRDETDVREAKAFLKAKGNNNPAAGDVREAVILLSQTGKVRYRYDWTLTRVVRTLTEETKVRNGDYISAGDEDEYDNMKDESSSLSSTKQEIERLDLMKYNAWGEGEDKVAELEEYAGVLRDEIDKAAFAVLHPMHKKILYSWLSAKYRCIQEEDERRRKEEEKKQKKKIKNDDDDDDDEEEKIKKIIKKEPDMKAIKEIFETEYEGHPMSVDDIKRLLNCAELEFKKERYGLLNAYKSNKKKYTVGIKYADTSEENDAFTTDDFAEMVEKGLW